MKSYVVYASRTGNTRRVAEAVAEGLRGTGDVELMDVERAPTAIPDGGALMVVGGPTEAHGMTKPVTEFFARLGPDALDGMSAAAFDTRVAWPRVLSGSAASGIARSLRRSGARVVVPEESFIVTMKPELRPGELERARSWGVQLAGLLAAEQPVVTG